MIDRKSNSGVDLAREHIYTDKQDLELMREIPTTNTAQNEVTSFLDTIALQILSNSKHFPVFNFKIFEKNAEAETITLNQNTRLNFIILFVNWMENGKNLEDAFTKVFKNRIDQIISNSQHKLIDVHTFSLENSENRKKRLILDNIDEKTAGIFIFDFANLDSLEDNLSLNKLNQFELTPNFQISEIQTRLNQIKKSEINFKGVMMGLFSETVQQNIVDNEFILTEFIEEYEDCFNSIILPTAYFPARHNMYFELAGIIETIVNLLSSKQDYRESFGSAQREIFDRCVERYSHAGGIQNSILASACSLYFAFESNRVSSDFITSGKDNFDFGVSPTLFEKLDEVVIETQEKNDFFARSACKRIEAVISDGIYASVQSLNSLTNRFPEYRKLLFSIVIAGNNEHWTDSKKREVKSENTIREMWNKFSSETKPNIIGKQTFPPKTTEGAILTAFTKSIRSIESGRNDSADLIYNILNHETEAPEARKVLEKLRLKITKKELSDIPAHRIDTNPANFVLDPQIMKYTHVLYNNCKSITHLDEVLKQAPITGEYEFLFVNSTQKNVLKKGHLKDLFANLKDALHNRYPEGYSYSKTTPAYRDIELNWFKEG